MYSNYPDSIDGYTQLPMFVDTVTDVSAEGINRIREAVVNIEVELGVTPAGAFDTVSERLDSMDTSISLIAGGSSSSTLSFSDYSTSVILDGTESYIFMDCTSGNLTVQLPQITQNYLIYIKRVDNSSNTLTVFPDQLTEIIEGAEGISLPNRYDYVVLASRVSDLTWYRFAGNV